MMKKTSLWLVFFVLGVSSLAAQQKYALVMGNGAYTGITSLNNPVNDARDMEATLKNLGWTVDLVINGNLDQMEGAAIRLKNRLSASRNSYGFLFYAGHGVQSGGVNYLIPVDANIQSENFLRQRAVSLQALLDELNDAGNELNIVALDACRDNPFSWKRSGTRGLQVVSNQPAKSIIVYATSAGSTAADGAGRNGLFTTHLLNNLKKPGLSVRDLFDQTGADVYRASGGAQVPAIYSQFFDVAYLGTRTSTVTPQPSPAPVQPVDPPVVNPRPTPAGFVLVPARTFSMGSNNGESWEKPVHQVTISKAFYMSDHEVTQKEWYDVMGATVRQQRDMWDKSYSLYGEGDNYPMYYVSWYDAVEYCNKRSIKEGLTPAYSGSGESITCNFRANGYRLPTEAEWEWSAKGGGKDSMVYEYSGSNSVDGVAWYSGNSGSRIHPVKTKGANSLGLYDMSGNVWEWCWDGYGSYSSGSQTDPTGAAGGSYRVFRGGSWDGSAQYARSVGRYGDTPSRRGNSIGFRLVRP
ncbi:MAG: SUMF1/EgtB/PvdO family nonheme iron enzyme [Treponema sp.]|jgi:formylglycine-generating enzyme required for sulfatase activity|nr:SUMF1/EgtB/PvdO family nonheme iron enzyme [Treponema sp.]